MTSDIHPLIAQLDPKERRGSKPRCHLLTHGPKEAVAARLSGLVASIATVSPHDSWMPSGFTDVEEAQLHKAPRLLDERFGNQLRDWWLAPASHGGKTPNFDIASTCTVKGTRGLLLIEAKAHDMELNAESLGRRLSPDDSANRRTSHSKIGAAIEEARRGLELASTLQIRISRDTHYQMSNRFAWAWKVASLGIPVVLVYLGLLQAKEMGDRGTPFATTADWERAVLSHSGALFPPALWNRSWDIGGTTFVPLIRSVVQPLDQ